MPHYEILRPCAYVAAGVPVLHKNPGAVVELTEAAAAKLQHRVKRVRTPKPPQAPPIESVVEPSIIEVKETEKGPKS